MSKTQKGPVSGMGLRPKFSLLLLVLACFFMGYIHIQVIPAVGERTVQVEEDAHRGHLKLAAEAIIPHLLEGDLARVYELLDAIQYDSPGWLQVELYSPDGRRLYPLGLPDDYSFSYDIMVLEGPVGFLQPPIATLKVTVDMTASYAMADELESSLLMALAILLLLLLLFVWFEVELMIRRPLGMMLIAARKLVKGSFHAPLPVHRGDEIGELARAFADMRASMERHHIDLAGELEVQRKQTEQLQLAKQKAEFDAMHDALTGLLNRRELERRVSIALDHVQSSQGGQYALLFIDLDHFKAVNDTCGHPAGDELLCEVTQVMRRCIREQDVFARMGGDEFAILLAGCELGSAVRIANDICRAVQRYRFTCQEQNFRVGASIGVTKLRPMSDSLEQVIAEADAACYNAKRMGRSRVEVATVEEVRQAVAEEV
ncbi:hypothetical protein GCM10009104_31670 [Marinobacterium maritimum]|uniref:diguanylate cyclase n=1 Tax=Marinobacterium maritimum TaxID=500162 RepID=A0ABN1IAM8_9GAMM